MKRKSYKNKSKAKVNSMRLRSKPTDVVVALRQSNDKFRTAFDNALDAIFWADVKTGRIINCNKAAERLLKRNKKNIIGMRQTELHPSQKVKYYANKFRNHIKRGKSFDDEAEIIDRYGKIIPVLINAYVTSVGGKKVISGIFRDITEYKKVEEKAQLTQFSVDRAAIGIYWVDPKGHIIYANKAACDNSGYSLEEFTSKTVYDIDIGFTKKIWFSHWKELKRKKHIMIKSNHRTKDGRIFPIEVSANYLYFNGKEYSFAFVQDITERVKVEEEIVASEEKYKALVENAPIGIYYNDFNGKILYGNKMAEEIVGYKAKELTGKNLLKLNLLEPKDVIRAAKFLALNRLGRGTGPDEFIIKRKDGSRAITNITTRIVNIGGRRMVLGMVKDITERKRAEEDLRGNERFLQSVFDGIQDGISILDSKLNIVRVNEWMEKMYAAQMPLVGKRCYEAYHGRKTVCPWCPSVKTLKDGKTHIGVVPYTVEGEIKGWILLSAYPLKDVKGKVVGVIEDVKDITEQRNAQEALRESEEKLRSLVKSAPNTIFISDREGKIQFINRTTPGIVVKDVIGRSIYEFIQPQYHDLVKKKINRVFRIGETVSYEIEGFGAHGNIRWYMSNVGPIKRGNRVVSAITISTDITESKKAERDLKLSEANYRAIFNTANDGIFIHDIGTGRVVAINNRGIEMLGYSLEEMRQLKVSDLGFGEPPYTEEYVMIQMKAAAKGKPQLFEWRAKDKNGRLFWVEVNLRRAVIGGDTRLLAIVRDITERKIAEEELRLSEERYRMTLDSMADPIHVVDRKFRIVLFNNAFKEWCKQLGLGTKAIGKTVFEVFPFLPVRVRDELKRVFSSGEVLRTEETHEIGGTQVILEVCKIPVFREDKVIRVITVIRDVTESRRIERMRENLIRDMSHSLKTPVAMLEMAYDIGQRGIKVNDMERIKKAMHLAENNVTRLRKDINNILEVYVLSRTKQEKLRKHSSVRKVIKEVIKNTKYILEDKSLSLKIDIQAGADRVLVVERELYTLLSNIIDNAVKFTEKGRISVSVRPKSKFVQIKVKDTGDGMTPDQRGMIFERFYKRSTATPGVGLGLTISKEIVDKCGGKIKITSKGPGKGTDVAIDLPKE